MTLVRYNPIRNLSLFPSQISNMLNSVLNDEDIDDEMVQRVWRPRVDIIEDEKSYKVLADLPGMRKEDVQITIEDGVLTLSGSRKSDFTDNKNCCYLNERFSGKFSRRFNLHNSVEADKIEAIFSNGVLTIILPKVEAALPKKIEIKAGK